MRVLLILVMINSINFFAQDNDNLLSKMNLDKDKIAVQGYDVVCYFKNQTKKGKKKMTYNYQGVNYYFENDQNRNLFIKTPNKFIPQYGGWCAYALSTNGELMEVDPKTYKITNGKLYLFYDSFFSSVIDDWIDDELVLIEKANHNWDKIIRDLN